jgi:hypothetical protein
MHYLLCFCLAWLAAYMSMLHDTCAGEVSSPTLLRFLHFGGGAIGYHIMIQRFGGVTHFYVRSM